MTGWDMGFALTFGLIAMLCLMIGGSYLAFGVGASRLIGGWFCFALAIGFLRLTHIAYTPGPDTANILYWLHIVVAGTACLVSIWTRASHKGFTPENGDRDEEST